MKTYIARSFGSEGNSGGNPTLLIDHAERAGERDLMAAAREFGGEATCIYRTDPPGVRFFLPTGEMAFCGHGVLAAAAFLARGELGWFHLRVGRRDIAVRAAPTRDFAEFVTEFGRSYVVDTEFEAPIAAALSLSRADRAESPFVNAGAERHKTLIELSSSEAVDSVRTSEREVSDTCVTLSSTGLYPFAALDAGEFYARQFPANAGFLEDAATGTAAIALATAVHDGLLRGGRYQKSAYHIRQGVAMHSPSDLYVTFIDQEHISIGGAVAL